MRNQLADTNFRLHFDLKVGGEFVLPDAGDFTLRILDSYGEPVPGYEAKVVPNTGLNTVAVDIPAADNTILPADSFASRFAALTFSLQGRGESVMVAYRLIRFMPVHSGPNEVRSVLGVSYEELPDEDIDIFQTYLRLSERAGFLDALRSGTVKSMYAETMVTTLEALRLSTSLQTRILKQEEKDNALYVRFTVNFDKLRADLLADYNNAAAALDAATGAGSTGARAVFLVTSPTDPITGV